MNDNQFAELLSKLKEYFSPLYVLLGLSMCLLCFILLIVFFDYYDKTLINKKKNTNDEFRAICRDELNKRDNHKGY